MADSTILKWTGRGLEADLERAVKHILASEDYKAKVATVGDAILVEGVEPTEAANMLRNLPGVEWVAVGRTAGSPGEVSKAAAELARTYLRSRATFAVKAQSTSPSVMPGDLVGGAVSAVLDSVKGARVDETNPSKTFMLLYDGSRGAAGVELAAGPGGTPVGKGRVACLVSGGIHSSVVAWFTLLSGLQVELVHAWVSEPALREVGRLYAELSHRVDPSALSLRVLSGGTPRGLIRAWVKKGNGDVCSGVHAECATDPKALPHAVRAPLYMLPEEEFQRAAKSLGLKGDGTREGWKGSKAVRAFQVQKFSGKRTDMHGVIDGLS